MTEPWTPVADVTHHWGVAKGLVYRWIDRHDLPAHRIGRLWKPKSQRYVSVRARWRRFRNRRSEEAVVTVVVGFPCVGRFKPCTTSDFHGPPPIDPTTVDEDPRRG